VLSTTLSEIRNREISAGRSAGDDVVLGLIARGIKQRQDSVVQMRSAGREELALKEEEEVRILSEFLPPQMDEDQVRALIRELVSQGATEMGPIMGKLMPRIRGRFDGKKANQIVREELVG